MNIGVTACLVILAFGVHIDGLGRWSKHTITKRQTECDATEEYQRLDGSCNNLDNSEWGAIDRELQRKLDADYDDGIGLPRSVSVTGVDLPHPRDISNAVHFQFSFLSQQHSGMFMQWGQFLDHTLTETPQIADTDGSDIDCCSRSDSVPDDPSSPCFPIYIATDSYYLDDKCINLVRSENVASTGDTTPRQHYNKLSAYIDASQIYGSDEDTLKDTLRNTTSELGLMNVAGSDMLPKGDDTDCFLDSTDDSNYCFLAGDSRVNVFAGLQMLHTLFLREHNRVATELKAINDAWTGDELFYETRKIIAAQMQVITYNEWLPDVVGDDSVTTYSLSPDTYVYNDTMDASLSNVFSTAAFRFGHSQVPENYTIDTEVVDTRDMFKRTKYVLNQFDNVIRAFTTGSGERADAWYVDGMRQKMFEEDSTTKDGHDIVALNIQRGREHGLPSYNKWRAHCGLTEVSIFTPTTDTTTDVVNNDFGTIQAKDLKDVYADADDMDLYSGGISEQPATDAAVGPLYKCLIGEQFQRIMHGDRFFYRNTDTTTGFTEDQITELEKVTLSRIICHNADNIGNESIQRKAFRLANIGLSGSGNSEQECSNMKEMNFRKWAV